MKALIRSALGLLALLLIGSVSDGYYWVSPVFKQPYPVAPSPSNSGFYLMDAYGRWTGPHYYLMPPCSPFNGILPGQTGAAIQDGYLPHTLLMGKEGLAIGNVPLLGQKKSVEAPEQQNGAPSNGAPQLAFGGGNGGPQFTGTMPNSNMQVPYGYVPTSPYPLQPAYVQPPLPQPMPPYGMMPYGPPNGMMPPPYGMQPQPMPQPYGMQPQPYGMQPQPMPSQPRPIGYVPYYGRPGMYANAWQDPRTGVWRVQNVVPNLPTTPSVDMNGFQQFGPMQPIQQFSPFSPIQGPQPPRMDMVPMQLPRMETMPPPQRPMGGAAYPTHPFTRSPRDFFMWGDVMEEERARGNRPFPVP
jgi:hypothetical protein